MGIQIGHNSHQIKRQIGDRRFNSIPTDFIIFIAKIQINQLESLSTYPICDRLKRERLQFSSRSFLKVDSEVIIKMVTPYEDEQFEIEDKVEVEANQSKIFQNKQQKSSSNNTPEVKFIDSRCKTIQADYNINLPRYSKSISFHGIQSTGVLPAKQLPFKANAYNKSVKKTQFPELNAKNGAKIKSTTNKTLKIFSNTQKGNIQSQLIDAAKNSQKVNSLNTNRRKKAQLLLSSLKKSQCWKVSEYFYHENNQLNDLSTDQLNRLTNKIKQWIKKLDKTLSDKISKAIIEKETIKSQQNSPNKVIELLQATYNNNNQIIKTIQYEYEKLQGSSGQLEEIQYEMLIDKQLNRLSEVIKNNKKYIAQLKKQIKFGEGKVNDEEFVCKNRGVLNELKSRIIQNRKQQEKNAKTLEKGQNRFQQITKSLASISSKYEQLIRQGSSHNSKSSNDHLQLKQQQLKLKIQKITISKAHYQSSLKRIISNLNTQIKNLHNQLRQYWVDINHTQKKISSIRQESLELIKQNKAKINRKHASSSIAISLNNSFITEESGSNSMRNPFIKNSPEQQTHRKELHSIRQSEEACLNLTQTEYQNQFLIESNHQQSDSSSIDFLQKQGLLITETAKKELSQSVKLEQRNLKLSLASKQREQTPQKQLSPFSFVNKNHPRKHSFKRQSKIKKELII